VNLAWAGLVSAKIFQIQMILVQKQMINKVTNHLKHDIM